MSPITTHVLDTSRGKPAAAVPVKLERLDSMERSERLLLGAPAATLGSGVTDSDGRLRTLLPDDAKLQPGTYRLIFDTATYFQSLGVTAFYPEVVVTFVIPPGKEREHHHVPLLLSPFGYSTYRGS